RVLDDAAPTMIAVADDADASHLDGVATVVRLPPRTDRAPPRTGRAGDGPSAIGDATPEPVSPR
ncbi:hypothetical protein ACFW9V_25020, partial [Streptomyces hygroscopicus]